MAKKIRSAAFYTLPIHERTARGRMVRKGYEAAVEKLRTDKRPVTYTSLASELEKSRQQVAAYLNNHADYAATIGLVCEDEQHGPHASRAKRTASARKTSVRKILRFRRSAAILQEFKLPVTAKTLSRQMGIEFSEAQRFLLRYPDFQTLQLPARST